MIRLKKGYGNAGDSRATWFAWYRWLHWEGEDQEELRRLIEEHNMKVHRVRPVVDIVCPKCGKSFFLEKGEEGEPGHSSHGVCEDGRVYPSVICPFKCGFHSWVILDGWTYGKLPEIK
jgi:hypothetical protein